MLWKRFSQEVIWIILYSDFTLNCYWGAVIFKRHDKVTPKFFDMLLFCLFALHIKSIHQVDVWWNSYNFSIKFFTVWSHFSFFKLKFSLARGWEKSPEIERLKHSLLSLEGKEFQLFGNSSSKIRKMEGLTPKWWRFQTWISRGTIQTKLSICVTRIISTKNNICCTFTLLLYN